jgi:hypothetical protein
MTATIVVCVLAIIAGVVLYARRRSRGDRPSGGGGDRHNNQQL